MPLYEICFRFDIGKAVAPVGELANELNTHLATMGYNEKLAITSELPPVTLEVSRELTDHEEEKVKTLIAEQFRSAFPTWDVCLVRFYRKSGNVQQSAVQ